MEEKDILGVSSSKSTNNERERSSHRTTREDRFVIIYKLEGCLPSRYVLYSIFLHDLFLQFLDMIFLIISQITFSTAFVQT